jgi:transposase
MKKHKVELTSEERQTLETLVRKGQHSALKLMRAHILLKADSQGPGWTDARIADAFGCHEQTAYNVRKRFATGGRLSALERKPQSQPSRLPKLDGPGEARLIALCCSDPPKGFSRWTLQLLADELVELQVVESISAEAVRQTLKKTSCVHIDAATG